MEQMNIQEVLSKHQKKKFSNLESTKKEIYSLKNEFNKLTSDLQQYNTKKLNFIVQPKYVETPNNNNTNNDEKFSSLVKNSYSPLDTKYKDSYSPLEPEYKYSQLISNISTIPQKTFPSKANKQLETILLNRTSYSQNKQKQQQQFSLNSLQSPNNFKDRFSHIGLTTFNQAKQSPVKNEYQLYQQTTKPMTSKINSEDDQILQLKQMIARQETKLKQMAQDNQQELFNLSKELSADCQQITQKQEQFASESEILSLKSQIEKQFQELNYFKQQYEKEIQKQNILNSEQQALNEEQAKVADIWEKKLEQAQELFDLQKEKLSENQQFESEENSEANQQISELTNLLDQKIQESNEIESKFLDFKQKFLQFKSHCNEKEQDIYNSQQELLEKDKEIEKLKTIVENFNELLNSLNEEKEQEQIRQNLLEEQIMRVEEDLSQGKQK